MIDSILLPILTGVISGIISSIIVTQSYRIKDREKDRVIYFDELNSYYMKFLIWVAAIYHTGKFSKKMVDGEPKLRKWIHLNNDEKAVIKEFDEIHQAIINIFGDAFFEIHKEGAFSESKEREMYLKYADRLKWYLNKLEKMQVDIWSLGLPEMKEVADELKKVGGSRSQ